MSLLSDAQDDWTASANRLSHGSREFLDLVKIQCHEYCIVFTHVELRDQFKAHFPMPVCCPLLARLQR
jgi:hypothetical protein